MANGDGSQAQTTIDFSDLGGKQVQPPPPSNSGGIDFSDLGGKVVQSAQPPEETTLSRLGRAAKAALQTTWNMTPPGQISESAKRVSEYANEKTQVINGKLPSPAAVGWYGALRDTANLIRGATTPQGLATVAATVAAPEVMGPVLIAHGVHSGITGWGDLRDPDVLQHELNAGAEIAGGAAAGAGALKAGGGPVNQTLRNAWTQRVAAKAPAESAAAFQRSVPPTKSAPYTPEDYDAARPYLEAEHQGQSITGVKDLRDAADSAIGKIEDQIAQNVQSAPKTALSRNTLADVKQALSDHTRGQAFVDAGLKELEDFQLDQPKSLQQMDDIRRQLNQENKAILRKNNYDQATARATDPGFAAREAAAESLRDDVYDALDRAGSPGMRELRLDEGSLIKLRNAAQNQVFNGDKILRGTGESGLVRQAASAGTKFVSTLGGAKLGGPWGAGVGHLVGEKLGGLFTPEGLTRDALVGKSFQLTEPPAAPPVRTTPFAPALRLSSALPSAAVAESGR